LGNLNTRATVINEGKNVTVLARPIGHYEEVSAFIFIASGIMSVPPFKVGTEVCGEFYHSNGTSVLNRCVFLLQHVDFCPE